MSVTAIKLDDGTEINAAEAVCEGCGSTLADHSCGGGAGVTTSVTYSRSGKGSTRKKPEEKPPCAHCGAPMHFNEGITSVNAKCIMMQYAVDKGLVTDPLHQKAPALTHENWDEVGDWIKSLATPITYGNMLTAAGGAGTYSALRPKTGRKKKVKAAAPGSQIQDMAADEDVLLDEATPPTKGKKGKGKKAKAPKAPVAVDLVDDEAIDPNIAAEATNGHDEAAVDAEPEAPVAAASDDNEAARAARAERRRQRKALLAGNR